MRLSRFELEDDWSFSSDSRSKARRRQRSLKIVVIVSSILAVIMVSILVASVRDSTDSTQTISGTNSFADSNESVDGNFPENTFEFDFEPVSFLDDPPTGPPTELPTQRPTRKPFTEFPTTSITSMPTVPPTWKRLECPPPRNDKRFQFSLKDLEAVGCHAMECVKDVALRNTHDRLGHNSPLCRGQALCNGDDEKYPDTIFQFGMAPTGHLVWQKCHRSDRFETEIITLYDPTQQGIDDDSSRSESSRQFWFRMTPDATWQVLRDMGKEAPPDVLWEQRVQNQPYSVPVTPRCLNERPVLDCPYIHFRRHGDIIMNYIDVRGTWVACKSDKICYSDLWKN